MRALLDSNPEYRAVTVMRVDWDTFRNDAIVRELGVPRRSTLIMFRGGEEIGRVVAQTSARDIEPLFQAAVR